MHLPPSGSMFRKVNWIHSTNQFECELSPWCRWYRQCRGIPQGSLTSPFLCNLFLNHLQHTLLLPLVYTPASAHQRPGRPITSAQNALEQPQVSTSHHSPPCMDIMQQPLLMRIADDFLLVSPCQRAAEAVASACMHELPKHGITVSVEKMACNTVLRAMHGGKPGDSAAERGELRDMSSATNKRKVPWCGLLIDSATLTVEVCSCALAYIVINAITLQTFPGVNHSLLNELLSPQRSVSQLNMVSIHCVKLERAYMWPQVDYERMQGMRVADVVNIGNTNPNALPEKICLLLNIRLHPILLDTDMNGAAVVARNVHVAVALAAMKSIALFERLLESTC